MKKIILTFILLGLGFVLISCGENRTEPTINGVEDTDILQGSTFDPLDGVSALDFDGVDLTDQIEVSGFVNSNILGEHNLTYTVEDSEGLIFTVNRYITVIFETDEPYQAYNGDFSLGTGGWQFDRPGGEAEWSVSNEILTVDISDPGSEWWQIQVYQLIEIEEDIMYKISFRARSDEGKTLGIGLEDTTAGYEMLAGGAFSVNLTSDFETYDFYYESDRTIDAAKLVLYLGQIGSDEGAASVDIEWVEVEISEASHGELAINGTENIVILLDESFDQLTGITATKGSTDITNNIQVNGNVKTQVTNRTPFVVQYVLEDGDNLLVASRVVDVEIGAATNRLFNSNFEMGVTGWTVDFPGNNAEGSMSVEEETLNVNILNAGTDYWHIQLSQSGREIIADETYELSFRAKADDSKTIGLGVENTADNFALLIESIPEFELTDEFVTYTYEFTAESSLDTVKYALFFGNFAEIDEATNVYIEFFTVREVIPSGQSVVENPNMTESKGWNFDFPVGEGSMEYIDDTVVANITDTSDAFWHIQLQQAGINVNAGETYLVSMRLKSSVERTVGLGLEDVSDGFASAINEGLNFIVGPEFETFHYVFTPEKSYDNLKIALFLGSINDDPASVVTVDSMDIIVADGQNILNNSTFEDDTSWAFEFNVDATGEMNVVDNQVVADITNLGEAWWHIQIFQQNVSIQENQDYLVSFRASSDLPRRIGLGIEDPADGFRDLKNGDVVEWDLTDSLTTYTYLFNSEDAIDTAKFAIFLGLHLETDQLSTVTVEDFFVIQLVD